LGVTGAGGPEPQSGQEPGTDFLAVVDGSDAGSEPVHRHFDGDPAEVCAAAAPSSWPRDSMNDLTFARSPLTR
jgi:nicotinamide-nucleotide amidase